MARIEIEAFWDEEDAKENDETEEEIRNNITRALTNMGVITSDIRITEE